MTDAQRLQIARKHLDHWCANSSEVNGLELTALAAMKEVEQIVVEECAKVCDKRENMKAYDLRGDALIRYEQDQSTARTLANQIRSTQRREG